MGLCTRSGRVAGGGGVEGARVCGCDPRGHGGDDAVLRPPRQGAVSAGQMYVTGGSGNGQNSTYAYNIQGNSWSVLAPMSAVLTAGNMAARCPPPRPASPCRAHTPLARRDLTPQWGVNRAQCVWAAISGGFLFTFGGKSTSALSTLQVLRTTTTVNQAWETVTTMNAPPPRNGHTTTDFGGIVYVFGGWNEDVACACAGAAWVSRTRSRTELTGARACRGRPPDYNDLWAFDTTQIFNNKKQWVNVIPNGAAGMPPARNSQSMVVIGGQVRVNGMPGPPNGRGCCHDV